MKPKPIPRDPRTLNLPPNAIKWRPVGTDPMAASTALALTIALLRALKDRGLLSKDEIDDLLSEAAGQFSHGERHMVERVRVSLESEETDE